MTNAAEKLCLQWNDFKENVSSVFGDLRQDKEFTDVTLVCEDGQQVEAHKLVLISSSPFFREASLQIPTRLIGRCPLNSMFEFCRKMIQFNIAHPKFNSN